MESALVSIITPTYNSSQFIAEAIRSVQAQSYGVWEIIVVDDCSTDDTITILSQFLATDKRSNFKLDSNSGTGIARNLGVEAHGKFIAF
jgi:glycosyltransferase involved in cell wall biosynthesis